MKYLSKYKNFESVIIPSELKGGNVRSFEDAVRYGKDNDFDVVEYDYFYSTLSDRNKRLAPPKHGMPFFALFNPIRKKAMFVVCDKGVFGKLPMKEIISNIIGHERVHAEQANRKGDILYELPSPTDRKSYFSNKEEVMAFSWSIANSLSKEYKNIKDAISGLSIINQSEHSRLWSDIKRYCDDTILNRYKKYIYLYLEKILGNKENKMHSKISGKLNESFSNDERLPSNVVMEIQDIMLDITDMTNISVKLSCWSNDWEETLNFDLKDEYTDPSISFSISTLSKLSDSDLENIKSTINRVIDYINMLNTNISYSLILGNNINTSSIDTFNKIESLNKLDFCVYRDFL